MEFEILDEPQGIEVPNLASRDRGIGNREARRTRRPRFTAPGEPEDSGRDGYLISPQQLS